MLMSICPDKKQHSPLVNIWSTLSGRDEMGNSSCALQLFGAHECRCTELTPSTFKSIKDDEEKNSLYLSFQPSKTFVHIQ